MLSERRVAAFERLERRVMLSAVAGDLDGDGTLDADDLDLLRGNPGLASPFDLDGDGDNDADDLSFALPNVYGTGLGDVNLDRAINSSDLAIVQANLGNPGGWATGDVDGDGFVDAADEAVVTAALGTVYLPADVYRLLDGRLDAPASEFPEPTLVDATTTALHAEFDGYFNATDEQVWRTNVNGDDVVDATDRAIFDNAAAGYPDASLPKVSAIAVPDGTPSFSVRYDDAALVDEVLDDWITPLFDRYDLAYDPADDLGYAELLDEHVPVFRYANLAHTTWGKGLAFLGEAYRTDGPVDATEVPELEVRSPVMLQNLGVYDSETGAYLASNLQTINATFLAGRFVRTLTASFFPLLDQHQVFDNDFRFSLEGTTDVPVTVGTLWSTEVNAYYHIDRFRTLTFSTTFIESLGLGFEIENNLLNRQYRDGGYSGQSTIFEDIPVFVAEEGGSPTIPSGGRIFPVENALRLGTRTMRSGGEELLSLSHGFDRGTVVGEYAGLLPFWISPQNSLYPIDFLAASQHPSSMTAVINDSVNYWASYRYTGESEIWRTWSANLRVWAGRPVGGDGIPALRGFEIGDLNSMMFDENNTSGDQIYPYDNSLPFGLTDDDYPDGTDRMGLFLSAMWWEMANDAGLGDETVDKIVWKTLSLLPDVDMYAMRQFGDLMLTAAAELFPDPTDATRSIYHGAMVQVMASRGIAVDGAGVFQDNLPTAIGDPSTMDNSLNFDSAHPNRQIALSLNQWSYGDRRVFQNAYTEPGSADFEYLSVEFYKHSKFGPADRLLVADGSYFGADDFGGSGPGSTIEEFGEWREDGDYVIEIEARELGNASVFIPGDRFAYADHRNRLSNEAAGPSSIDFHSFGWIATQSMKNGFSIEVQRVGSDADTITYDVSIVDPSLSMTGGDRTGPATYDWSFSNALGETFSVDGDTAGDDGQTVRYTARRDEPFDLSITRTRAASGIVDVLDLTERGNDFDRDNGKALYVDAVRLPTVTVDTLTTQLASPALFGTVSDPTAEVEVWFEREVDQTYQTAEVYQAVNQGDGTWVLPAGVVASLPDGTFDVRLRATVDGKLSVVDDSADELTIGVPLLPGDANGDGTVNLADFGILRANFGTTGTALFSQGDFNNDGNVDLADFGILRANFGMTLVDPNAASLFDNE
ncbi:MAG: dockerin type I domain-containing protein [Planctomycetota bacterium]